MQTSFPRERVGTYRQAAARELSAARTDAGQDRVQPGTAGSVSRSADPSGLDGCSAFLPRPSWAAGVPVTLAYVTLRLWEDEVCSISPGCGYTGTLTFPPRLH